MIGDILSVETDTQPGEPLIQLVMQGGRRIAPSPSLAECRARAARDLGRLPESLRRLELGAFYPVQVTDALVQLSAVVDSRLAQHERPQL
jgi:nicotinate phosphoribosyltransferase